MTRIGVISNPRSHASNAGQLADFARHFPKVRFAAPQSRAELQSVLADFARQQVSVIAVDGGDGTVRAVITDLPNAYPGDWPDLALLASGKTNVIAADLGSVGRGDRELRRLLAAIGDGTARRRTTRPALEAAWGAAPDEVVRGFLFGAAAFSYGTILANKILHPAGIVRGPSVAVSIAEVLRRTLFGAERRHLAQGEMMHIAADGDDRGEGRRFILLATTLNRLMLGLWPFWGEGDAPIHWLDVSAPPQRLLRGIAAAARGRPRPWMAAAGWGSGRAQGLDLGFDHPFIVDGDIYPAVSGNLRLSVTRPIGFLSP